MKNIILLVSLILSIGCYAESNTVDRLNKNGVALCEDRDSKDDSECYDPVSYIKDNKPMQAGKENSKKFRFNFKGATYVFSSLENLNLFQKKPESYLPKFGGWCAYDVADSKDKVDIDPKSFLVQDGQLLLFYNGTWADTKKTWLNDKKKNPSQYLMDANTNWPAVKNKEP